MLIGILFGLIMSQMSFGKSLIVDYVKPFGTIFINSLKLIAIPLILASLIKGISDLKDISKLSMLGSRTIALYLMTTVIAVSIGLTVVNIVKPGKSINNETRIDLLKAYGDDIESKRELADNQKETEPLKPLIDLVPDNIFLSLTENKNMLQVIFFSIFFGIGLILLPKKKSKSVKKFIDSLNHVILKLIDIIMNLAPYGVFSLLASLVVEAPSLSLFKALGMYSITLLLGLVIMILFYSLIIKLYANQNLKSFFKGISPAQLLAFSTSSSAATLPVTLECVNKKLKVDKEISSFVLPIGATVNMDGTSIYQAVAAVFIAQAFGIDLSLTHS